MSKRNRHKKANSNFFLAHHEVFEHGEPLAATVGVVGGGAPCHVPTWVERAKNNTVLKKIELTFRKFQSLL